MEAEMVDDGGLAFPCVWTDIYHDQQCAPGMSLRDWFAGQSLIGQLILSSLTMGERIRAGEPSDGPLPQEIARAAYLMADAMLAARKRKEAT